MCIISEDKHVVRLTILEDISYAITIVIIEESACERSGVGGDDVYGSGIG